MDVGAGELVGAEARLNLVDGDHLKVIALGFVAQLGHVGFGGVGVQVGVVDQAAQVVQGVDAAHGGTPLGLNAAVCRALNIETFTKSVNMFSKTI